jgi:hypothetical protein
MLRPRERPLRIDVNPLWPSERPDSMGLPSLIGPRYDRAATRQFGHRTTLDSPPTKSPWGLDKLSKSGAVWAGVTPSYH